ncbi:hypothetical protein L916_02154 [Phytophthora nicotianae]|uniref:Helitron helicase-like domain-containing protein n=1 Tax=Phytophthora nicotianae TaxID=4792 RepID=W2JP54_PHYNI|nr:hypothetical protein L916_02154 [Phytophthora nicotianae]
MLPSFDYLSVQKMYTQLSLKCQRHPVLFEPYSDIKQDALVKVLSEKELLRQGLTTSTRDDESSATDFLKTVELSGSSIWALFVTLTPNVADSFVIAQYCGVTSVDTLFDAALSEMPGRSALHSANMRNDIVSAKLFMRNMEAFIEHVLGVQPKHMKNKPIDGLFGDVKAYFGMIETQGGGTLHAHFLIWLADAPPNSDAFNRAMGTNTIETSRRSQTALFRRRCH